MKTELTLLCPLPFLLDSPTYNGQVVSSPSIKPNISNLKRLFFLPFHQNQMGFSFSLPSSLLIIFFLISTTSFLGFAQTPEEDLKSNSKASKDGAQSENLWCVAKNNADDAALQAAIDWACGAGQANCGPIQSGGPCFDDQNFQATASYAFNDYYIKHGSSDDACDFGHTAALSSLDPSHGNCKFPSSTLMISNGSFVGSATAGGSEGFDTNGNVVAGSWGRLLMTIAFGLINIVFLMQM